MKKLISITLLLISIVTFFILYTDYKEVYSYKIKNVENTLENSNKVVIPIKLNSLPREKQYENLLTASNGSKASLYFTRIDQVKGTENIIKYIYLQDEDYLKGFKIIKGRNLTKEDMDTSNYISSKSSDDPNQVGVIGTIGNIDITIKTLRSMKDDGYLMDGECTINLGKNGSIEDFSYIFDSNMKLEVIQPIKMSNINNNSLTKIAPILIVMIVISLYEILLSYREIAIKKSLGFSVLRIWIKEVSKKIKIQIATIVFSIIGMSLIIIKDFNVEYIGFYKYVIYRYLVLIAITIIVISLPFIYANTINITSLIKNKTNVMEIIVLNNIIKITLSIVLVFVINMQIVNYYQIKNVFDESYKRWDDVSKYRVLSLNRLEEATVFSREFNRNVIECYKEFNRKGAILAEFSNYTQQSIDLNRNLGEFWQEAVVNPNYLIENPAYDSNGEEIRISEDNKNLILIVPDKYKNDEEKIREKYKITDEFPEISLQIIWMKTEQRFFSYNFTVDSNEGGYVKDPILKVIPENGSYPVYFTMLFNTVGNPIKVKSIGNSKNEEEIMNILDRHNLSSYGVQINYANEQMASNISDYKELFKWIVISLSSCVVIIFIIIWQNIINYFDSYKCILAIKKIHGFSKVNIYKNYLIFSVLSWLIVGVISLILKLSQSNNILGIVFLGMILELILTLILIKWNDKTKLLKSIKKGI